MTFTPTPEQLTIVAAATDSTDNLLVQALAGAAKTSTLILLAESLSVQILALAFNKKIAVEMQSRMPSNVKCMTLNGLGHRTWTDAIGKRVVLDKDKNYNNLKSLLPDLSSSDRDGVWEKFGEITRLISFAKQCGYIPTGKYERGKRLMDDDEFFNHIEQKLSDVEIYLIRECILLSIAQGMKGQIDFDDQIYLPTLFHGTFPRYPLTLVDEAQDLSALNHATLRKMVKDRRLIAVGDSRQAIYGFRGAHEDSMNMLREDFSMRELELTVSFRCPRKIVEHARWRAPQMKFPDWAIEGEVKSLASWDASTVPAEAAILCRNNAPLFSLALKLLIDGRHVEVGGQDIIKALIKILNKFGDKKTPQAQVLAAIDAWEAAELEKTRKHGHGPISDRAECMRVFARAGGNLAEALNYANHIMNSSGPLKLLTGHRAKGLEFPHVFILDASLIGREDQDPNLRYVMQTRAKETLTYVTSEGYVDA